MYQNWETDPREPGGAYPFDGSHVERVVPADGDPETAGYRANVRGQMPPRAGMFWWHGGVVRPRHRLRRWLVITAVVALAVLLLKPLLVLAAVVVALLLGLLALGVIALGALLLAGRAMLGGRYAYFGGRGAQRGWRSGAR
jgi:hypothetical protein